MSDLQNERQIPVFTVWKNNSILKNIFLINTPPNNFNTIQEIVHDNHTKTPCKFAETLLVGRHPDCDIRLEHPSISRFHLRVHSLPSSKLLFITDLSSVHGTWVSGKRIEPNNRKLVKENDDLRIGGSSRVYKLHWIPFSQAYDVSKPFVPPLDFPDLDEDEDEMIKDDTSVELKGEEVHNVDNISDDICKSLESLDLCDDDKMVSHKVVPRLLSLQPQISVLVKDEVNELVDIDFEVLECLDDISLELEQKEMVLALPIHNEDFEDEDTQSVDSILEGLVPLSMGVNKGWIGLQENSLPSPIEEDHLKSSKDEDMDLTSLVLERFDTLFLDENSELLAQKVSLSAPLSPQNLYNITTGGQEFVSEILGNKKQGLLLEDVQDSAWSFWYGSHVAPSSPAFVKDLLDTEYHLLGMENESPQHESESLKLSEEECIVSTNADPYALANDNQDRENESPQHESESLKFSEEERMVSTNADPYSLTNDNQDSELWSFWSGKMGVEAVCSALSDAEPFSESETKSLTNGYPSSPLSSRKWQTSSPLITSEQKSGRSIWSRGGKLESFSESENESCGDCYQSPKPLSSVKEKIESLLKTSDQNYVDSIWSRREKLVSTPQALTSRIEEKKMKTDQKSVKYESMCRALFHGTNDQEEEEGDGEKAFTPDKENFTPSHKSMRKFAMLKDIKKSSSGKSPLFKMTCSPNNQYDDIISPLSDKENYSLTTQQKQKTARLKERKVGRMSFQSLLANSPQKSINECYIADVDTKNASSVSCANVVTCKDKCIREGIRQWIMVADTTTLLNNESRKELQLLEGLKGTQLIIPRIVITELSSLKRQVSFFRRNTEVLSALEWIQDCMVKSQWWIHVQNSIEEVRPVAPTPPASPHSSLSCRTAGSYAFSGLETRRELLSPAVEDDVLDYALSFRKNNNDGQLVLLSNDITTKIKAMTEGMICETSEEFRQSLVNPFSERFRWTDSSPRGQTWSCADDFVLKEKFYPTPKAMENVKGLKLVLLYNSGYYERMTAIH